MLADNHKPLYMLVVDDDPAMTKLIAKILKNYFGADLDITEVVDSQTAVNIATGKRLDLCITDMDMPNVNGFKVLKTIKQTYPLTQAIILTAHPVENAIISAFSMGADDFLLKPIDPQVLIRSVQFMMDRLERFRKEIIFPVHA